MDEQHVRVRLPLPRRCSGDRSSLLYRCPVDCARAAPDDLRCADGCGFDPQRQDSVEAIRFLCRDDRCRLVRKGKFSDILCFETVYGLD
jgi:hypothetical protein